MPWEPRNGGAQISHTRQFTMQHGGLEGEETWREEGLVSEAAEEGEYPV